MAIGCTAARQPKPAAEAPQIVAILPRDLQPVPAPSLPTADRLALLHKALTSPGNPHDVILEIARIGDATSVPFLIEALAKQGTVPSTGPYTAICTRSHCSEALQAITNQDAGRNAEDWRSWYEANGAKNQEQWIREGFAQHGFPVTGTPDDAVINALIRASAPTYQPGHIRTNAQRMLTTVPPETVLRLAASLADLPDVSSRRAAVAALERVPAAARLTVLRTLARDPDIDVAENALRVLNSALRIALSAVVADSAWDVRLAKAGVHVLHILNDRTVVLGIGYGIGQIEVHAVGDHVSRSLVQGRRKVFGAVHNGPLLVLEESAPPKRVPTGLKTAALSAVGDVICLVSFGPSYQLQCLEQETLRELWRADLPNEVGAYNRLEQDAENVYVFAQGRALAFNVASGKRLWATNEFTSGAFFKTFGRAALTRNENFELEWRDPSSGEVIAQWEKRERSFADGAAFLGEAVLVETRDRAHGDGLRLLRLPNTIAQRLTAR